MDATAQSHGSPFAGTELDKGSDALLSNVWDWCVIKGCRPITMTGRLFVRKGKWTKYRCVISAYTSRRKANWQIPTDGPYWWLPYRLQSQSWKSRSRTQAAIPTLRSICKLVSYLLHRTELTS
jgi:hypothetical protein